MFAFFEILASTFGPGPYWTINNLEEYSKLNMLQYHIEKHIAPEAYSKHAPGTVCISNMVLEHI